MINLLRSTKVIAAFVLLGVCGFARANFIFNSSFELNSNAGSQNGANDLADGWTNYFGNSAASSPDVWDNNGSFGLLPGTSGFFTGVTASGGTKFATLGSIHTQGWSEGMESSSFSLLALQTYRVSANLLYDQFAPGGYNVPSVITVRLRQNTSSTTFTVGTLAANTLANTWQNRFLDFSVGTSDSYTLILRNEFSQVSSYIALDQAGLDVVPEPVTMAGLATALLGLASARKRKRI